MRAPFAGNAVTSRWQQCNITLTPLYHAHFSGLWWGGGKGVIAREKGEQYKDRAFRDMLFAE
jgi:hypothetical protein